MAENPQDSFYPCLARRCSARTIVDAAVAGELTETSLTELIAEAAQLQQRATYAGELRQRSERMFVAAFFEALQDGAAVALIDHVTKDTNSRAAGRSADVRRRPYARLIVAVLVAGEITDIANCVECCWEASMFD